MTKIGIISDIHAGLNELHSAIAVLQAHQVDSIVCAGDLVDYGSDGDAVVDYIAQSKIPCVQGNHDLRATQPDTKSARLVSTKTRTFLASLPQTRRFLWDGKCILLAHATPWGEDIYIYPDSTPYLFRRVAKEADADIVILGHTHHPMWIEVGNTHIINAGSTSQNYTMDTGTCGILSLPDCVFTLLSIPTGKTVALTKHTLDAH
ncbi:MAG: YfcE family phosphodiesterase [Chloroflexota bacterium]